MSYERQQQRLAERLQSGERITRYQNHHIGMTYLKAPKADRCTTCGDEREVTLSLVTTENAYAALSHSSTDRAVTRAALVSNNPDDYIWECRSCNMAKVVR